MNRYAPFAILAGLSLLVAPMGNTAAAEDGPTYENPATKEIVAKMVEAHGGLKKWRGCPSIGFDSHLKVDFGGGNWVEFWEEVTVDPVSRRVYADLPNADGTKGMIAFDGKEAWSAGNLQGIAQAPARFTAWRNFYLFNIPWLTQDAGVTLGEPGKATLLDDTKEYITIRMAFKAGAGDTHKDTYILYIDPGTYQLKAAEYGMTYKSMLPEGVEETPRSVFVWEGTTTVDGFVALTNYTVYWTGDGSVAVVGDVSNWSFKEAFDESRMTMPSDGTADQSQPN